MYLRGRALPRRRRHSRCPFTAELPPDLSPPVDDDAAVLDAFDEASFDQDGEVMHRRALRDPRDVRHGRHTQAGLTEKSEHVKATQMSERVSEFEELIGHDVRNSSNDSCGS